jgi:hypothetical protein
MCLAKVIYIFDNKELGAGRQRISAMVSFGDFLK